MKAVVFGSAGQLGRALVASAPDEAEVCAVDRSSVDITEKASVKALIEQLVPDVVLNAAAYTAVDKAEAEEDLAYAVNATAVTNIAEAANSIGARFVHVSTDFVFDGMSGIPYRPEAAPNPLSAYGRTKLAGERLAGADALIVRTAWVYAPLGPNFVRTMLRLMDDRDRLGVVCDQIGTPTYAPDLAAALWDLQGADCKGIYHYTDSGVASWYDFAVAIQEEARAIGLLDASIPVIPIGTSDYPTPARRPPFSVLDKTATMAALDRTPPHWRDNIRKMLNEIKNNG